VRQPALTPGQKKALDGNYEPGDLTKDDMNNLQYNELATIFKQAFGEDQDRLYKYLHQQARYEVAASLFPHWDNAEDKLIGFYLSQMVPGEVTLLIRYLVLLKEQIKQKIAKDNQGWKVLVDYSYVFSIHFHS